MRDKKRTANLLNANLWLYLFVGFLFGVAAKGIWLGISQGAEAKDILINFGTEFIGIVITVGVIDSLNKIQEAREIERREAERLEAEARQLKGQLIRELGSFDRNLARRAAIELDAHGWHKQLPSGLNLSKAQLPDVGLKEAVLQGVNLSDANLENANFRESDLAKAYLPAANLRNATFSYTNLSGADLRFTNLIDANLEFANLEGALIDELQLVFAARLNGAVMPDGSLYDGRFRLPGDIFLAEFHNVDIDSMGMAAWYDRANFGYQQTTRRGKLSDTAYIAGTEWAIDNLDSLRASAEKWYTDHWPDGKYQPPESLSSRWVKEAIKVGKLEPVRPKDIEQDGT